MKDTVFNRIIHFCLKHCYPDSFTLTTVLKSASKDEIEYWIKTLNIK